jgi:hypothetical protein
VKPPNKSDRLRAIKVQKGDNSEEDTPSMLSPGGLMRRLASMRQGWFDEPTGMTHGQKRCVSLPLLSLMVQEEKRSFGKTIKRWTSAPIKLMLGDTPSDFAPVSSTDMDGSSPEQVGDYNTL